MASTTPGHIALNGREYVLQDETYSQQLQTPFNPRFSTGDPGFGDLSFFQFLAMQDWSGGNGQDVFSVTNRFDESENIDVTNVGEMKLAPKIEFVAEINGPESEHLDDPVEDEDAWPQIIEWLGRAVIYNDQIEFDVGGVDFLEVFETEILADEVISDDTTGTAGVITNDTDAEILAITVVKGLPGDTFNVTVRFKDVDLHPFNDGLFPGLASTNYPKESDAEFKIEFRLYFGGNDARQSVNFAKQELTFAKSLFTVTRSLSTVDAAFLYPEYKLTLPVTVEFTVKVPNIPAGIYSLWASAEWAGRPWTMISGGNDVTENFNNTITDHAYYFDDATNAKVLFFVQGVDIVPVVRKNLYAPQLKAAAVVGSRLVGGRTVEDAGYVEVYQEQNDAVDRILQLKLSDVSSTISSPTYMALIGSNGVVVAAFDNRIYKIDILTDGLTTAQRFTFIGIVPGTYVSGLATWNQRVYIASFDKSLFKSTITWTDLTEIQGSYDIDGKFWITDLANFQGALFYSGGTQGGLGEVRAFPSIPIIDVEHPQFDSRVRTLNAGRLLYGGWSHGTGLLAINERGASAYSSRDLGALSTNVVWDIEEVGANVYLLAGNALYKTTPDRYATYGWLESSDIDANTPLIRKIWTTLIVEARELTSAHTIRVFGTTSDQPEGQWVALGEYTVGDGRRKEFPLPSDFQAHWFKWRIEIHSTDENTTPVIPRVLVKYVPSALDKWQWVLAVRATDMNRFLNGQMDSRKGEDVIANLKALRTLGPVTFRDIDEETYQVLITDMRVSPPLIDKGRPEAIVSLELLEI